LVGKVEEYLERNRSSRMKGRSYLRQFYKTTANMKGQDYKRKHKG